MTKSKMRIYKGRGYSDHVVVLYMTDFLEEDVAQLRIRTAHEEISVPARDALIALWPLAKAAIEGMLNEAMIHED